MVVREVDEVSRARPFTLVMLRQPLQALCVSLLEPTRYDDEFQRRLIAGMKGWELLPIGNMKKKRKATLEDEDDLDDE